MDKHIKINMISFIIPSYNNLKHLKNCWESIKKHAPQCEVIFLDDGSTDGTWEWLLSLKQNFEGYQIQIYRTESRLGHTILYDKGIGMAQNNIVGILHADMIIGPNYVENILKHLKPLTVVCGTRVEPPLHPAGKEKIIQNFGLDFDSLNVKAFDLFCYDSIIENKDKTTKGMFAPWVIYKEDFLSIGGHDPLFAPFPYEDSDIFQRWILNGYELIQSRDAFVYHLTCRGHRWTEEIGKDDEYYKNASSKAARNYIRKWGSWIANDQYQYPIIYPKYDIGLIVHNCSLKMLELLEPWGSNIYIWDDYELILEDYLKIEQHNTTYNLRDRIKTNKYIRYTNDILVEFDLHKLTQESFNILKMLPQIIKSSGEIGKFELDIFKIEIRALTEYQNSLINIK